MVVVTRRLMEREKERKRRERLLLPRYKRGLELIQTYYILLWAKNQLVPSVVSYRVVHPFFFLFIYLFFILPIAIFIDAHGRLDVHYTPAAQHTWSVWCRMFTLLQSKTTPLIGRFYLPVVVVCFALEFFSFLFTKIHNNKNFIHCLLDAGGFHGV